MKRSRLVDVMRALALAAPTLLLSGAGDVAAQSRRPPPRNDRRLCPRTEPRDQSRCPAPVRQYYCDYPAQHDVCRCEANDGARTGTWYCSTTLPQPGPLAPPDLAAPLAAA